MSRHESIAALPFPRKLERKAQGGRGQPQTTRQKSPPPDRLARLAQQLKVIGITRPRTRNRMVVSIKAAFGGKMSDIEPPKKLEELVRLGVISVEALGPDHTPIARETGPPEPVKIRSHPDRGWYRPTPMPAKKPG